MRITSIAIQNFRKLLECHIDISKQTALFVGANNTGKTSTIDALAKFLANRSFVFNDITIASDDLVVFYCSLVTTSKYSRNFSNQDWHREWHGNVIIHL